MGLLPTDGLAPFWPVLCLTVIDPWQGRFGIWSEETPDQVPDRPV